MKLVTRVLSAILLAGALAACQVPRSAGLVATFGPTGAGSTTLLVAEGVPALSLAGTVQVVSGQLRVVVTPPTGPDEYDVSHGSSTPVNATFPSPKAGTWQLRVESVGGTGEYNLRMYY